LACTPDYALSFEKFKISPKKSLRGGGTVKLMTPTPWLTPYLDAIIFGFGGVMPYIGILMGVDQCHSPHPFRGRFEQERMIKPHPRNPQALD
jgi:hypothetical protein